MYRSYTSSRLEHEMSLLEEQLREERISRHKLEIKCLDMERRLN